MTTSEKIRAHFMRYPQADVDKVAARFNTAKSRVYKLRKEATEQAQAMAQDYSVTSSLELPAPRVVPVTIGTTSPDATDATEGGEIESVLRERGDRYGPFENHAKITQQLKDVMRAEPGWDRLTYPQREALEMVAHKIGRMLNGDPTYEDNVVDILGYSDLMLRCMRGKEQL
jgi:hypothetical protein